MERSVAEAHSILSIFNALLGLLRRDQRLSVVAAVLSTVRLYLQVKRNSRIALPVHVLRMDRQL